MSKFFNIENFNKYLNYLRPWSYLVHPKLKLKTPRNKIELLLAKKELRQWLIENIPHNSRKVKILTELEHVNRELHYLQFRKMFIPVIFWLVVWAYFRYSRKSFWGYGGLNDRPYMQQNTGGTTMMNDGTANPKNTQNETMDFTGGI